MGNPQTESTPTKKTNLTPPERTTNDNLKLSRQPLTPNSARNPTCRGIGRRTRTTSSSWRTLWILPPRTPPTTRRPSRNSNSRSRTSNRWLTMKSRDVTMPVMPPSVPTDAPTNSPCQRTRTELHWNLPSVPPNRLKARRLRLRTDWPNSKPCTTTPLTANERPRTTSTLCKKRSKNWRTTPRHRKTKQPVLWLRLPDSSLSSTTHPKEPETQRSPEPSSPNRSLTCRSNSKNPNPVVAVESKPRSENLNNASWNWKAISTLKHANLPMF